MSRLLAIRLSALGDVIHTIPAVVALRDRYDVTWVVESPYRELVEIVANVKTIPVSLRKWDTLAQTRRDIRGFDVAIDFQGLIKSALIARASGAKERIGFARELVREKPAAWFMSKHVRVDATKHVVDWNLELAEITQQPSNPATYRDFPQGDFPQLRNKILLLPGAGRPEKMWPIDRFRELAHELGDQAVAVWGPGEEELARRIGCAVAPRTSLRELASVLQGAQLVIGADTGPLHLADALGTRVIGLYGPTNPKRNGPYGQLDRCISTFETSKRMDGITVGEVMRLIK